MERNEIIEQAGNMVLVKYMDDEKLCFVIGWFFAMSQNAIRVKITSTKHLTYESQEVPIDGITEISVYQIS